jgi:hypothetical protein
MERIRQYVEDFNKHYAPHKDEDFMKRFIAIAYNISDDDMYFLLCDLDNILRELQFAEKKTREVIDGEESKKQVVDANVDFGSVIDQIETFRSRLYKIIPDGCNDEEWSRILSKPEPRRLVAVELVKRTPISKENSDFLLQLIKEEEAKTKDRDCVGQQKE